MVDRPLEDVRPLGPILSFNEPGDGEGVSQSEQNSSTNTSSDVDPLLETAENWYESISDESNKRKMMKNYLGSVSELSEPEIDRKLDEAGL